MRIVFRNSIHINKSNLSFEAVEYYIHYLIKQDDENDFDDIRELSQILGKMDLDKFYLGAESFLKTNPEFKENVLISIRAATHGNFSACQRLIVKINQIA